MNPNANTTYALNFPGTELVAKDIKRLTPKTLDRFGATMWLMSPPCQPFSRRGARRDVDDACSAGFLQLLRTLPQLRTPPEVILLENVEGFEGSRAHERLLSTVRAMACGYSYRQFVLSPHNFGPGARVRASVRPAVRPSVCLLVHRGEVAPFVEPAPV